MIRVVIKEFVNNKTIDDKYYYHQLEFISNKDTKKIQELTDGRRVQYPESIMPVFANNITQEKQKVKSKEIRREIEEKPIG